MSPTAIGIDLGTTYSCVGVFQHGKVEIIANDQGNRTTPSCVAFTDSETLVGEVAKNQAARNPENTVFDAKRMIGRRFDDPELQMDLEHWPFKVCDHNGEPKIKVKYKGERKKVPPVEISAMILSKMKKMAEAYLGEKVTDAVITVPAYFNNSQRQATKNAGQVAGLNVKRIINEPTAAALAYGLDKKLDREQTVLIFDLGGGTFDVSILSVADGVFQVLSTAGDTHLGGEDFDHHLVKYFCDEFKRRYQSDLSRSPMALRRLKTECEQAKRTLSSSSFANIEIDSLYEGFDFSSKISRARFDELCSKQFGSTLDTVQRALKDANLARSEIDEVVLVGGSTRIPKIRKLLQDFFDGKRLNLRINADEAVAYGAAVQAAALSGASIPGAEDHVLLDVVPFSLGVREGENNFQKFVERNSRVPIRRQHEFILATDNQTTAGIKIYEGEKKIASENNLLGEFLLDGLPAARRGDVKFTITFDIDEDGILNVRADERTSGRSEETTIRCLNFMGADELRRMQKDAAKLEEEAEEEEKRRMREEEEDTEWNRQGEDSEDEDRRKEDGIKEPCVIGAGIRDKSDKNEREEVMKKTPVEKQRGARKEERRADDRENDLGVEAEQPQKKIDHGKDHEKLKKDDGEERSNFSGKGRDSHANSEGSSTARQKRSGKPGKQLKVEGPPIDAMSESMLFIVQSLLEGDPKTSIVERLEIYHRCVGILEQLDTSKNPRVQSRSSELQAQLRKNYPDACGSFSDVTTIPGREPESLNSRVKQYACAVIHAVFEAEGASVSDRGEVSDMCVKLMSWVDDNENAGGQELLRRIKELQSVCGGVTGLQMPSDDVNEEGDTTRKDSAGKSEDRPKKENERSRKVPREESKWREKKEAACASDTSEEESDVDQDGGLTNGDDGGRRHSDSGMPPLEDVY